MGLPNVLRVAVGYTHNDGWWQVAELSRSIADPDVWVGTVPFDPILSYFVQAVDGAGNVGIDANKSWYYGPVSRRPRTRAVVEPLTVGANGWRTTPMTVTLTAVSAESVISNTLFALNGPGWQPYTTPLTVTVQGTTTLAYYSIDSTGQSEPVQTTTLKLDTEPPVPNIIIQAMDFISGSLPAAITTTLTVTATDSVSGLDGLFYQVDDSAWLTCTAPVTITFSPTTTFRVRGVDRAGNEAIVALTYQTLTGENNRSYLPIIIKNQ